jgi:hypothetical protein
MTLSEILSMDDRIDSMSDTEVRRALGTTQLMFRIMRESSSTFRQSPTFEHIEGLLQDGQVREAAELAEVPKRALCIEIDAQDQPAVDTVADWFLNPDASPETIRGALKSTVKGTGMPDIIVARERIYAMTD